MKIILCTHWWYDTFARALITADTILQNLLTKIRADRYASSTAETE